MSQEAIKTVLDIDKKHPEMKNVMCGLASAYCERGSVSQEGVFRVNKRLLSETRMGR